MLGLTNMPQEIERKFLVKGDDWRSLGAGKHYKQGYIASEQGRTVRVRVVGEQAWLTIKGNTQGIARAEYEYPLPLDDALEMLENLCPPPLVEKTRYRITHKGNVWEVDEFAGDNAGLVIAEIELNDPDQAIALPEWVGQEVSDDPRYFNVNLAKHPYSQW